jgi:hypothetical protein
MAHDQDGSDLPKCTENRSVGETDGSRFSGPRAAARRHDREVWASPFADRCFGFNGWETFAAFQAHASFIRNHQGSVERLAVIVGHDWQHWLVDAMRMFLHPDAKAFDKNREEEARKWVAAP